MGDRRNFLDAGKNIREQNLRFVKSDLEQNLNQYFSSGSRGGCRGNYDAAPPSSAPSRDYKVVQPNPGGRYAVNSQQFPNNGNDGYSRNSTYRANTDDGFRTSSDGPRKYPRTSTHGNNDFRASSSRYGHDENRGRISSSRNYTPRSKDYHSAKNTQSNRYQESGRKRHYSDTINNGPSQRRLPSYSGRSGKLLERKDINKAPRVDKSVSKHSTDYRVIRKAKNRREKEKRRMNNARYLRTKAVILEKTGVLKPPSKGHLKHEPEKYWTEWWSKYAYIEQAIEEMDKNEEPIRTRLQFEGIDSKIDGFLRIACGKINRSLDINEVNYDHRDVYKVVLYKKQLEDPKFQKRLQPSVLKSVEKTLNSLNNKILALVYQSLLYRWDLSMDLLTREERGENVNARYARVLIDNKVFHYLVLDSLHELKKLTSKDWPGFEEFYKTL